MFLRFLPIRQRVRYNCKKRFTACANQEFIQENVKLKDSCQGKRCFILGNGPSIKKEDLNLLADEIVFTVNDMYLYEQFNRLNTNYHLLFDPAYFADISKRNPERNDQNSQPDEQIICTKRISEKKTYL